MKRAFIFVLMLFIIFPTSIPSTSAAQLPRAGVDRPDDLPGYQIHFVYVQPAGAPDGNLDTTGQIDGWVREANAWLKGKIGHQFIIDTYQGATDVTFMSSKYLVPELCLSCDTLSKLKSEYIAQNPNFNGSKTLVFVVNEILAPGDCGWANVPGNLAIVYEGNGHCNYPAGTSGLSWPATTLIHELIHSFGIAHQCLNNSDIMIGSPECNIDLNTYGHVSTTIDITRNLYVGSETASGVDILRMPIWADGTGLITYSTVNQTSDNKYVPKLTSGLIYAIVGKTTGTFEWVWDKKLNPKDESIVCEFLSGETTIKGNVTGSKCTFEVPGNLRAGKNFTVKESWNVGPWHGEASTQGTLVRDNLSSTLCTTNTCFAGGSTTAKQSCWSDQVKNLIFQQLMDGKWVDITKVTPAPGPACSDSTHPNYPNYTIDFSQTGTFIYRWVSPARPGVSRFEATPFAVVVNDANFAEPSATKVDMANAQAIDLGKAADLAQQFAEKAAAEALAAQQAAEVAKAAAMKKTTITCIKGKLIKTVTAVKPVCPIGYGKK